LYLNDRQITDLPLTERKKLLSENIKESERLAISRFIETNGVALYSAAAEQGLEGVIAKKRDSKYYFGKTTKDWIKMKALFDEDFVVCGYYFKAENIVSVILGAYTDNAIVYQSHVAMGVSREDFKIMSAAEKTTKSQYPDFPEFGGAMWLKPRLVCSVQFMERTPGGGLRQPVFKGLREDKSSDECRL